MTDAMEAVTTEVHDWIRTAHDGDVKRALTVLGQQYGVAVYAQDRSDIESELGRPLTDEEWSKARPHLADFTEWMNNSGGRDSVLAWRDQMLDHAGVPDGCEQCGEQWQMVDGKPTHCDTATDADHEPIFFG